MAWRSLGGGIVAVGALLAAGSARAAELPVVGCDRAAQLVELTASAALDPACVYTGGFKITRSDVTLDCRGALIEDVSGTGSRGVFVTVPADQDLARVTVRNCEIAGFTNTVRVNRSGFKALEEGEEYVHGTSEIVIEDSLLRNSRGSGVFVDGYVTGVTLRGLEIVETGSVGIYLEAGSKDNVVVGNTLRGCGFGNVEEEGISYTYGAVTVSYLDTGREGIAIDGSRNNRVEDNLISGSAAGGIFLYKNCGEFVTQKPDQWWERRYGADGNVLTGNRIEGEDTGIWVGSRMAQNQVFMDCSDPTYLSAPLLRVHLDYAGGNTIVGNTLVNVGYGIRVEDDDTVVEDNVFASDGVGDVAVVIGTRLRTEHLEAPVAGTVLVGNQASLRGNDHPYVWIHDHAGTTVEGNLAHGRPVGLVRGRQPDMEPFLFCEDFWVRPSGEPPGGG